MESYLTHLWKPNNARAVPCIPRLEREVDPHGVALCDGVAGGEEGEEAAGGGHGGFEDGGARVLCGARVAAPRTNKMVSIAR